MQAQEVAAREALLCKQIEQLNIQIDETKRYREVAQLTETDYFRNLAGRAQQIRQRQRAGGEERTAARAQANLGTRLAIEQPQREIQEYRTAYACLTRLTGW